MNCLHCHKSQEYEICVKCFEFAFDKLARFPTQYNELERELIPSSSQSNNDRVRGSKTPPAPVRLEVLDLRSGGISFPLMLHEAKMRHQRQETRITFRGEELNKIKITCEYISVRSDWIWKEYLDAPNLVQDIIKIHNKISSVLGHKSEDVFIGICPTQDEEGNPCGAKLRVNPQKLDYSVPIECKKCKTSWDSSSWRLLGRMLQND